MSFCICIGVMNCMYIMLVSLAVSALDMRGQDVLLYLLAVVWCSNLGTLLSGPKQYRCTNMVDSSVQNRECISSFSTPVSHVRIYVITHMSC